MAWQGWENNPEPNTDYDKSSGFMHTTAAGTADDPKVYFDSYMMMNLFPAPGAVTTNVPGSRMVAPFWYQYYSMLGFWVDCNGDNFIGNAVTGQTTYSAALGVNEDVCPPGSAYNKNGQVDEFRAIIRPDPDRPDSDPRDFDDADVVGVMADEFDILDPDARVFGDWGLPTNDAVPSQGIMPLPPGTLTTYHGHFKYVDDATLGDLSARLGANGVDYYSIPATLDANADTYVGPHDDEATSPVAYVRYAWNDSRSGEGGTYDCGDSASNPCEGAYAQPFVVVVDCSKDPVATYDMPKTIEEETWFDGDLYVPAPTVPGHVNTDGSIDGTTRRNARVFTDDPSSCDEGGESVLLYDNLEIPEQGSSVSSLKVDSDFNYIPAYESRIRLADGLGLGDNYALPYNGYCASVQFPCSDSYWFSNVVWSRRPPRAMWGITQTLEVTNYAFLSGTSYTQAGTTADAALPDNHPGTAQYGAEQCKDANGNVAFGPDIESVTGTWDCDPEAWNVGASNRPLLAHVSEAYDLRDQDCFDGSLQPGVGLFPTDKEC